VYEEPTIEQWSITDLGLKAEEVGLAGSPTRVAALEKIKRNRKCDMMKGEPQELAADLMTRLSKMGAIE
jgi:electron transfer flavoprotein alpha/beta subunit